MMTAALRAAWIEGSYEARDIPPPLTRESLESLLGESVLGANVTVPHKEAALELAMESTSCAQSIGAANVLVRRQNGWRADNTDGPGFLDWVNETPAARARIDRAIVLGAGGSARAVVWALLEGGASRVRLMNRTRKRADALAREFGERVEVVGSLGRWIRDALLVNCTTLGMQATDPLPVGSEELAHAGAILDLVYPDTPLVREARRLNIPAETGLGLLVAQGARAFHLWTGVAPDREIMLQAALDETARRRSST
jgi:shikimate dehydrogenase